MKMILKFIFRNIKEKKLRTILVLFSIILSTALVFSTLTISGTVKQMITNQLTKYTGNAEIVILKNPQSPNPFISLNQVEDFDEQIDYMIGAVSGYAVFPKDNEKRIYLTGFNIEDLTKMYDVHFEGLDDETFSGNKVIIGKGEALLLGLEVGDVIELKINQQTQDFVIYGIAKPKGLFNYDEQNLTIILPRDTLASIYGANGMINKIYVKTKVSENLDDVLNNLTEKFSDDYIVKTTITTHEINENIKSITSTFFLMLVLVIFISVFIIYTSFKVITLERLPQVGTFRSIGATKKMTDLILLGESIIYGIIGGVFGCLLGFGILYVMMNVMAYNPYTEVTTQAEMVFGIEHLLFSFLTAVLLSVVSALIPIIKVSKTPVRNIVLNNVKETTKKSYFKTIIGITLLIIPLVIVITGNKPSIIIGGLCIISIAIAIVILIPIITWLFVLLFEKVNHLVFKNEGVLAAKNLRNNKNIVNNITLLTIGIASLLMINTVSQSVMNEVVDVFHDADFQINFQHVKADDTVIDRLIKLPGIKSVNGNYTARDIKIGEKNDYIDFVWGIDAKEYFDYWKINLIGDKNKLIKQLGEGRYTIISMVEKEKYNLKLGDKITLEMKNGDIPYEIIGFTNTLFNNGNFIFIDKNNLIKDAGINYLSDIMIKTTSNPKNVATNIKKEFESEGINVIIMSEQQKDNIENNQQMFSLLTGFSIITMVIGIFGIFNNFVVCFISRKRSLAVYSAIGMSKKQVKKMLFVESLSSGMIGGLTGVCGGLIFIMIASYIMKAMYLPISMDYSIILLIIAFISGIIVSIVSSIIPTLRSSKLNIIEAIKYE